MAPPPSHSQSLLPRSDLLILDRIERDAHRFRLIVHLEQEPACPVCGERSSSRHSCYLRHRRGALDPFHGAVKAQDMSRAEVAPIALLSISPAERDIADDPAAFAGSLQAIPYGVGHSGDLVVRGAHDQHRSRQIAIRGGRPLPRLRDRRSPLATAGRDPVDLQQPAKSAVLFFESDIFLLR